MSGTYTQKQVAERAGVSRSTVRDVVNGTGRIPEATRLKVERVLEEMNYRPHAGARDMVLRRGGDGGQGVRNTTLELWWNHRHDEVHNSLHQAIYERFQEGQPQIDVQVRRDTDIPHSELMDRLLLSLATGNSPSCHYVAHPQLHKFIRLGLCADISRFVEEWDERDLYAEPAWDVVRRDGRYFGIPTPEASITMLQYNRRLLAEQGVDESLMHAGWDELLECAIRLTRPEKNQYGLAMGTGWNMAYHFVELIHQYGGRLFRQAGDRMELALDEGPAEWALQFVQDLRWKYAVLSPDVARFDDSWVDDFAAGRVAVNIGPPAPQRLQRATEETGLAPLPAGPGGERFCQLGIGAWIINAQGTPAQQRSAWEWLKFQNGPEAAAITTDVFASRGLLRLTQYTFRDSRLLQEVDGTIPEPWMKALTEARQCARFVHYPSGYELELLQQLLLQVLTNPKAHPARELEHCLRNHRGEAGSFATQPW